MSTLDRLKDIKACLETAKRSKHPDSVNIYVNHVHNFNIDSTRS